MTSLGSEQQVQVCVWVCVCGCVHMCVCASGWVRSSGWVHVCMCVRAVNTVQVYGRENGDNLQPQRRPHSNILDQGNGRIVHNASDGLSPSNTVAAATGRVPVQECGSPSDAQSNTQNEVSPELAIVSTN